MCRRQKLVLKIFGDILSDSDNENPLPCLGDTIESSLKRLMNHFIPSLFEAIQLLLKKPAVLGGKMPLTGATRVVCFRS